MAERLRIRVLAGVRVAFCGGPGAGTKGNKDVSVLSHHRNTQKGLAKLGSLSAHLPGGTQAPETELTFSSSATQLQH